MIREFARKIRASQPFNRVATDAVKFVSAGRPPEFFVKYLPRSGSVSARLPNGKKMVLWSKADEGVTNHVFWNGWDAHEPETCHLFFDLAQQSRVTIDVGAHIGYYSLLAALANPAAQVFAFEPLPEVLERLAGNMRLNRVTNVTCSTLALGTHPHEATFYRADESAFFGIPSSSGLSHEFMSKSGMPLSSITVHVTSLDLFVKENALPTVDLIKMDTEETEPDVIRGGLETISKFRPKIICEVLRRENPELEQLLGDLGYRYFHLSESGPKPMDKITAFGSRDNYLFSPS